MSTNNKCALHLAYSSYRYTNYGMYPLMMFVGHEKKKLLAKVHESRKAPPINFEA